MRRRVLFDVDVLFLQRSPKRRGARLGAQTADRTPLGAIPERGVQCAEAGPKLRRAREHEQERQLRSDLLAGVQQCASDLFIQGVGLVEQQHQRTFLHACCERLVERGRAVVARAPPDSVYRDFVGREVLPPGGGQQTFDQLRLGADRRRGEPNDVHSRGRRGFFLQPHQQRRLAVAARPVEDDLARRRTAEPQAAHERQAEVLLVLPPGQIGRQSPVSGLKRTQHVVRIHGGRMTLQPESVNRRYPVAAVPPAKIENAGSATNATRDTPTNPDARWNGRSSRGSQSRR